MQRICSGSKIDSSSDNGDMIRVRSRSARGRALSDPGLMPNDVSLDTTWWSELVEMKNQQKQCGQAVEQLHNEQNAIQSNANEVMVKIEAALLNLHGQQVHLAQWESVTKVDLEAAKSDIAQLTSDMREVLKSMHLELEQSRKDMKVLAEQHETRTNDLYQRTNALDGHYSVRAQDMHLLAESHECRTRNLDKRTSNLEEAHMGRVKRESSSSSGLHRVKEEGEQESSSEQRGYTNRSGSARFGKMPFVEDSWSDQKWGWEANARKEFKEDEFPTGQWKPTPSTAYVNLQVSEPPKFECTRYETFRKEILWWRDIHSSLDDNVLISTLAVRAVDDALKSVLSLFMEKHELAEKIETFRIY